MVAPDIETKTIEMEAENIDEARKLVQPQIPAGFIFLSEQILSGGTIEPDTIRTIEVEDFGFPTAAEMELHRQKPAGYCYIGEKKSLGGQKERIKMAADTSEEALEKARSAVPAGARIVKEFVNNEPAQKIVPVEAFSEDSAKFTAISNANIGSMVPWRAIQSRMTAAGKGGVLGLGKKPNRYEVVIFRAALVYVDYEMKTTTSWQIGKMSRARILVTVMKAYDLSFDTSRYGGKTHILTVNGMAYTGSLTVSEFLDLATKYATSYGNNYHWHLTSSGGGFERYHWEERRDWVQ